jgi:hypothetical protein
MKQGQESEEKNTSASKSISALKSSMALNGALMAIPSSIAFFSALTGYLAWNSFWTFELYALAVSIATLPLVFLVLILIPGAPQKARRFASRLLDSIPF